MTSRTLRTLIEEKPFVTCPGVFDLVSAKLADRTRADALYMTGYGAVASYLGLPDAGLATYSQMLDRVQAIAQTVRKPSISRFGLVIGLGVLALLASFVVVSAFARQSGLQEQHVNYVLAGAAMTSREALAVVSELSGVTDRPRLLPAPVAEVGAAAVEAAFRLRGRTPPICREASVGAWPGLSAPAR